MCYWCASTGLCPKGAPTHPNAYAHGGARASISSIPFSARHFEYSIEYSTYIPCRQAAIGWPTVDSGACRAYL
eukprot:8673469-Pyramimonas_sp.AAC.1